MQSALKNIIGGVLIIFLLAFIGLGYMFANSYEKAIEPSSFRSFVASAEGDAISVPDVAIFTASVITEGGTDVAQLQQENTSKMNAIIEFLKSGSVDEKDIKTTNYSIRPRQKYSRCNSDGQCPPPEIVGYSISQSVAVKVRDISKAGGLLSGIVSHGANSASSLSFEIDDPTKVQDEARDEAIKKAQKKAQSIAASAGFKLGRLLSLSENYGDVSPTYYNRSKAMSFGLDSAAAQESPSIEPGSQEVKVSVDLTYEIK